LLTILAQTDTTTTTLADGASGASATYSLILSILIIGGLFYLLMIRPQRNRMKRQEQMISELAIGDEVQTIGGIYGRIEFMDDTTAVLQTEGGGRIRVARRAVAGKTTTE